MERAWYIISFLEQENSQLKAKQLIWKKRKPNYCSRLARAKQSLSQVILKEKKGRVRGKGQEQRA